MINNNIPPRIIRGSIAIKNGDDNSWIGVFKKDKSYPLVFGEELWNLLQENWKTLQSWGKELLEYSSWEDYLSKGFCKYCGKFVVGEPCKIKVDLIEKVNNGMLAPDLNAVAHSHLLPMANLFSKNEEKDGLWIEWVYVISPETYTLEIFKSVRKKGTKKIKMPGKLWEQPKYMYFQIGIFSLFQTEPDWEFIENKGSYISSYYHNKYPLKQGTLM